MKTVRRLTTLALSGIIALQASQDSKRIFTILATNHNPQSKTWSFTCKPDSIPLYDILEAVQFAQQHERWTSSIVATHGRMSQIITEDYDLPELDTTSFSVDLDKTTNDIIFTFKPTASKNHVPLKT